MKPFTLEMARAALLAKLAKAGAKGIAHPVTAKTPAAKRAPLEEALAALEAKLAVFVDRQSVKPRWYAWESRPTPPTVPGVAARLLALAAAELPAVATRARWQAALKQNRAEAALLEPALQELLQAGRLERFVWRKARAEEELFLPARGSAEPAFEAAPVRESYARLVAQTGFPAVAISQLQRESAAPLARLQAWVRGEQEAGRAILSRGDWSLADETKRSAAVEWKGEPHLLVRLLS